MTESESLPLEGSSSSSTELAAIERELLHGQGARLEAEPRAGDHALAVAAVARFRRRNVVRNRSFAALGVLAAAAGVVLALNQHPQPTPTALASANLASANLAAMPRFEVAEGALYSGGQRLRPGQALVAGQKLTTEAGAGCLVAGPGMRVCLGAASEIELGASAAGPTLRVLRGVSVAELAPLPAGQRFSLGTQHGEATVVGTVFAVELLSDQETEVRVSRGAVAVHNRATAERGRVNAGASVRLGVRLAGSVPSGAGLASDLQLLGGVAGAPESAALAAESAAAPPHAVSPRHGAEERLASEPTARALLEQARTLRGERHYGQAANAYRQLLQRHPRSTEARAALVSLGQLQLSNLGDAAGALASFERYLNGTGQLRQEAQFGKIQALERLGRSAAERRAINAFLASYPNSAQGAALKLRLGQLH